VELPPDVLAATPDLYASVESQLTAANDDPGALVALGSELETSLVAAGITAPVTVTGVTGEAVVVTVDSSASSDSSVSSDSSDSSNSSNSSDSSASSASSVAVVSASSASASSAERGGGGYWALLLGLCCCCLLCSGGGYVFKTHDKAAPYREKMKEKSAPHLEKLKTLKEDMMKKKTEETAVQKVEEGGTDGDTTLQELQNEVSELKLRMKELNELRMTQLKELREEKDEEFSLPSAPGDDHSLPPPSSLPAGEAGTTNPPPSSLPAGEAGTTNLKTANTKLKKEITELKIQLETLTQLKVDKNQ
jgi:hypothetical protein